MCLIRKVCKALKMAVALGENVKLTRRLQITGCILTELSVAMSTR